MRDSGRLCCDGCGQTVAVEHIARRLKRLEQATKFRPIHIHTIFLGAVAPLREQEYLYAATEGAFQGESETLLERLGIERAGKTPETVLTEFQRRGCFLTHMLECPLEEGTSAAELKELIGKRLPRVVTRVRRSLRPKRAVLLSGELNEFLSRLREGAPEIEWMAASRAGAGW